MSTKVLNICITFSAGSLQQANF